MIACLYDCFKHWAANGTVYIYSDPHFEDSDCKLMSGEWPEPEEQVARINARVKKNDTIIILGDIGNPEWVKKINGYKVMIAGNHDRGLSYYKDYFDEVYGGPLFIADKIVLSHEPIDLDFALNIHGHCHCSYICKTNEYGTNRINVASDVIHWKPMDLNKDIIKQGFLKPLPSIHRLAINAQIEHPVDK